MIKQESCRKKTHWFCLTSSLINTNVDESNIRRVFGGGMRRIFWFSRIIIEGKEDAWQIHEILQEFAKETGLQIPKVTRINGIQCDREKTSRDKVWKNQVNSQI